MLIVEENEEFTEEFTKEFSAFHITMCCLHNGTKLLVFLKVSFSKCSMKIGETEEIGEPIAAPEVCS